MNNGYQGFHIQAKVRLTWPPSHRSREEEKLFFTSVFSVSSMPYFKYKGIPFSPEFFSEETLSYVENDFQLLDDDIVNLTYPKSGTHWMSEILSLIQSQGDPSWVQNVPLWERAPWIELDDNLQIALKNPPPRLLATHLPFQLFPKSFLHSKAKVVYTLRNPRDAMVSSYHFIKGFKVLKDPGTVEEFMERFLRGESMEGGKSATLVCCDSAPVMSTTRKHLFLANSTVLSENYNSQLDSWRRAEMWQSPTFVICFQRKSINVLSNGRDWH
ncbi:sulfotransferase 2B1-like [Podarcis lilfordi]|uniref:Sulfotransferase n=1 Tax=Podarcis lilfordi TaxID=74358 RepID=A0AA35PA12_9SAUR|nr:sulfotransferase 2B1-like [Podarcis lilfordi]